LIEADKRWQAQINQSRQESIEADKRLEARINQFGEEACAEDKRLGERIDALVSAIGQWLQK
jgi:hypothetical protein